MLPLAPVFWSKLAVFPKSVGVVPTMMWWTSYSYKTALWLLTCYFSSASSRANVFMYRKTATLKTVKCMKSRVLIKSFAPLHSAEWFRINQKETSSALHSLLLVKCHKIEMKLKAIRSCFQRQLNEWISGSAFANMTLFFLCTYMLLKSDLKS